jgi:hypothetical protein
MKGNRMDRKKESVDSVVAQLRMSLPFECWWDSTPELVEPRWLGGAAAPALGPFSGITTNPMLMRVACARLLPGGRPRSGWDLYLACATRSAAYLEAGGITVPFCVQLDPRSAFDVPSMLDQAAEIRERIPEATIKVPMTRAGIDVIAALSSAGVNVNATWGFCVSQLVAAAEAMTRPRPSSAAPAAHVLTIMEGRIGELGLWRHLGDEARCLRAAECAVFDAAYDSTRHYAGAVRLLASSLRTGPGRDCWHYGNKVGRDVIVTLPPSFLNQQGMPVAGAAYGMADDESMRAARASQVVRRHAAADGFEPYEFDQMPPMVATHLEAVQAMADFEGMAGQG